MADSTFRAVIPARYASTRLPGKVLRELAGKPMLQHVWERAGESGAASIVIATDDDRVADAARAFGADVCMTSPACHSGTDRVAEVCRSRGWADDLPVVNVQGDAPLLPPSSIALVAQLLVDNPSASLATLCVGMRSMEDYLDPHVVKVVFDKDGRALYFSRSPIPAAGHGHDAASAWTKSWRHLGLYAYRVGALQELSAAPPAEIESLERLEQLRALWLGMEIRVAVDESAHGPDVDTLADLAAVEDLLKSR